MPALTIAPSARFTKTEAGRQEIRARAHALSRGARNLLFILDDTRPGAEWLTLVQGTGPADLHALLRAHLVVPSEAASASRRAERRRGSGRSRAGDATSPPARRGAAFAGMSYADLYAGLSALVHQKLGLIKGHRFTGDIERATGLDELADVAWRFVDEVHKTQGDEAAWHVRRALHLQP